MREEERGKTKRGAGKAWLAFAAVAVAAVLVVVMVGRGIPNAPQQSNETNERTATVGRALPRAPHDTSDRFAAASPVDTQSQEDDSEEIAEPRTEEERREAEEEKLVETFDGLTDKWQEPSAKGVTMADIDSFAASFRKVPKARQDECIHRALNLIPDENVMLLAGVLMDKSVDKEIVETVYNDILNRDEDVKKPILQQIFKDKSHPCWADTAWILDVTDELPRSRF